MTLTSQEHRLGAADRLRLAAEIVSTYVRVRTAMRGKDVRTVLSTLRERPRRAPEFAGLPVIQGVRLGRAVTRTLTGLPADSRCLTQAMVLTSLLARRGIDNRLVIGVRPGDRFGAHAWVEVNGNPVLPRGEEFPRLVEL
jgi:hypothetical protein